MRLIHFILIALLAVLALVAWMLFLPVPPDAVGVAHPLFPAMKIGGDGAARLAEVGHLPYVMQQVVLVLAILLIALGVHPRHRSMRFWAALIAVAIVYQIVWWNIWFRYQEFLATGDTSYFLGFATPTAWMIFGIWLSGIGLMLIYVVGFRQFVLTEHDEAEFNKVLQDFELADDTPVERS